MNIVETWFGQMTHGTFHIGNDENPIVIVDSIDERIVIDEDDIESYMDKRGYDSYVIPSEFIGQIVFSQSFFKGLTP
jgi:hypothetical protein